MGQGPKEAKLDRKVEGIRKLVTGRLKAQRAEYASHPDADTLSAFAEQALSAGERKQVLDHLDGCRDCRDIVYLALPSLPESQQVVGVGSRRAPSFALRWGTLAAMVAVIAVLLVGTRRHNNQAALYKVSEAPKSEGYTSAQLKTPSDIAEIHALHDDGTAAVTRDQMQSDKVIPTPKHVTARPATNFDIDQTDQVRMMSRSDVVAQNKPSSRAADASASNKLDSGAPAAASGSVVGGAVQNSNALASNTPSGESQTGQLHAAARSSAGGVNGTITDPSGAVIANATVTVVGPVGTRAMQSDTRGQFAFDRLNPGDYTLKAQARGFQTAELQRVAVQANQAANLQLQLQVGAASESVEVTGQQVEVTTNAEAEQEVNAQLMAKAKAVPAFNERKTASAEKDEAKSKKIAGYGDGLGVAPQWTLSPEGAVQRSLDSGRTWQPVRVANVTNFRSLSSNGADVWVGGPGGFLFHSTDSGQSWRRISAMANGQKLTSDVIRVDFADKLNGTVATAAGQTWTTSDGGQTWKIQ